ncbi:hypothetical protein [Plantactinospora sp. CA-290183]|uniref:hypothetical protein n=1 Tax=Plantactinospora sp. CA-290183 TaxID=3240006 RepID=UPI003D919DC6
MGTPCYVGFTDPDRPETVHARFVQFDGNPGSLIPQLRGIWTTTASRDTKALIDAVLAHDWEYLAPDISPSCVPGPAGFSGQRPIAGVGMTLGDVGPQSLTLFTLDRTIDLGASWIYLINAADNNVAVHSGSGELVGVHSLG